MRSEKEGYIIEALSIGNIIIFRKNPSASAVFEEVIHFAQGKAGKINSSPYSQILCEIEAAEKLLKNRIAYAITNEEIQSTIIRLNSEKAKLKILMERGEIK